MEIENIIFEINFGLDIMKRELVNWKIFDEGIMIRLIVDIILEIMYIKR